MNILELFLKDITILDVIAISLFLQQLLQSMLLSTCGCQQTHEDSCHKSEELFPYQAVLSPSSLCLFQTYIFSFRYMNEYFDAHNDKLVMNIVFFHN